VIFIFEEAVSSSTCERPSLDMDKESSGAKEPNPFRLALDQSIQRSRKVRGGNYVQLATVGTDGGPRVRTVVQRGITGIGRHDSVFKFITDQRSAKVSQIRKDARGELAWWFLKSSEQYRVAGVLTLHGNDEKDEALAALRKQTWGNLRDSAREQFYWAEPGLPLNESAEQAPEASEGGAEAEAPRPSRIPAGGRDEAGKVLPAPDAFLLMLLWADSADYLRLTDNHRVVFRREEKNGGWVASRVNP